MPNKKAFTFMEALVSMVLFSVFMLILSQATVRIGEIVAIVDDTYENSNSYNYISQTILREVKSSTGVFQIEDNSLRLYRSDGTYIVIEEKYKTLYIGNERIPNVTQCKFTEDSESISVRISLKNYTKIKMKIYKPRSFNENK